MIELDVLVVGAGPAGSCAALRLRQLGYRVGMVERMAFPRAQIGESLTPGTRNILSLLDADEALAGLPHIAGVPTLLRWEHNQLAQTPHNDVAVVSRADFDARLCQLAKERGVQVWQPARVLAITGQAGAWRVTLGGDASVSTAGSEDRHPIQTLNVRWIFEATGRHGAGRTRLACAPSLLALCAEWDAQALNPHWMQATQVEALSQAWLWAAHLPSGHLRVLLLADSHAVRGNMQRLWQNALQESTGLQALSAIETATPLRGYAATPYIDTAAWQPGRLKLGDAAFALDPLSGSGVEKAMRFSLQAVVAWHTWASATDASGRMLAQQYFLQQLHGTCARHVVWCAGHYGRAWCANDAFWQGRSVLPQLPATSFASEADPITLAFFAALNQAQKETTVVHELPLAEPRPLPAANTFVRIDPASQLTPELCVMDNRVQLASALSHPHLARAVAFVANQTVAAHWALLCREQSLGELHQALGRVMPAESALAMLHWLWRSGVLVQTH